MPPTAKLTPKQERFVSEYLIDLNATQAAIRAGYSKRSAAITGFGNLRKSNIESAIALRRSELANSTNVTQERVIEEYARLGFANMRDYVKWDGTGVTAFDSDQLSPALTAAVVEVSEVVTLTGRTFKFKLHDKKGALDKLAQHLGLLIDRHEITGKDGGPIQSQIQMQLEAIFHDPDLREQFDALLARVASDSRSHSREME